MIKSKRYVEASANMKRYIALIEKDIKRKD